MERLESLLLTLAFRLKIFYNKALDGSALRGCMRRSEGSTFASTISKSLIPQGIAGIVLRAEATVLKVKG